MRGGTELTSEVELRKWDAMWHEQADLLEQRDSG